MPKYFFDLHGEGRVIPDSEGVELRDDTVARRVAAEVIEEFLMGRSDRKAEWKSWRLHIRNAGGRPVATISLERRADG